MTMPHYISENQSDMRGIKHGWYAIEDDGNLSSGPFPSFEECLTEISSLGLAQQSFLEMRSNKREY